MGLYEDFGAKGRYLGHEQIGNAEPSWLTNTNTFYNATTLTFHSCSYAMILIFDTWKMHLVEALSLSICV